MSFPAVFFYRYFQSRDMQTEMEERFRNEIAAQDKLLKLYKVPLDYYSRGSKIVADQYLVHSVKKR